MKMMHTSRNKLLLLVWRLQNQIRSHEDITPSSIAGASPLLAITIKEMKVINAAIKCAALLAEDCQCHRFELFED